MCHDNCGKSIGREDARQKILRQGLRYARLKAVPEAAIIHNRRGKAGKILRFLFQKAWFFKPLGLSRGQGTGLSGFRCGSMTQEEEGELRAQLARLQQEHRDLDAAIVALAGTPGADAIQVQRLKRRKLALRDRISFIEDQLTPDIIA